MFSIKPPKASILPEVEKLRNVMLNSSESIHIFNFGTDKSKMAKIKNIASTSLTSKRRSKIIYHLIQHFNCKNIIELGTNLGINTLYMSAANPEASVYSIEACPNLYQKAKQNSSAVKIENVIIINDLFENALPKVLQQIKSFDFIYIDGNHSYEATMKYVNWCLQYKTNESMILLDDIHWSKEMYKAWKKIKEKNEITLTIDYYYSGLIFFKKELSKQNFKLRYKYFFKYN